MALRQETAAVPRAPASYIIDVCIHCGQQAVWPFSCGHRDTKMRWTMPLHVTPSAASRKRVQKEIERNG